MKSRAEAGLGSLPGGKEVTVPSYWQMISPALNCLRAKSPRPAPGILEIPIRTLVFCVGILTRDGPERDRFGDDSALDGDRLRLMRDGSTRG